MFFLRFIHNSLIFQYSQYCIGFICTGHIKIELWKFPCKLKQPFFIYTFILASVALEDRYTKESLRHIKRVFKIYKGNMSILVLVVFIYPFFENITGNIKRTGAFKYGFNEKNNS